MKTQGAFGILGLSNNPYASVSSRNLPCIDKMLLCRLSQLYLLAVRFKFWPAGSNTVIGAGLPNYYVTCNFNLQLDAKTEIP